MRFGSRAPVFFAAVAIAGCLSLPDPRALAGQIGRVIGAPLCRPASTPASSSSASCESGRSAGAGSRRMVVYVGSADHRLYALDATNGNKLWSYKAGGPIRSKPVLANGNVYFTSGRSVYALSAGSGVFLWRSRMGHVINGSPATNGTRVFVDSGLCCATGVLYALNARNGKKVWTRVVGDGFSSPACCFYSRAFRHGLLFVGYRDGKVAAVQSRTGRVVWSFNAGGDVQAAPRLKDGVVYLGSGNGKVYALDATTGRKKWSFHILGDTSVETTPLVKNGVAYVGACDSHVYALNARSGSQIWAYATDGCVPTAPAAGANDVFVGCQSGSELPHCFSVYAINRSTGRKAWTHATGGSVSSSPALANGVVYVGSDDHSIYALRSSTGAVVWRFRTQGGVASSPVLAVCGGSKRGRCRRA